MKNTSYFLALGIFLSASTFSEEPEQPNPTETETETKVVTTRITDKVEMETTTIKGNTELPKILYLVPWKSVDANQKSQHQLILHSLYGDVFTPQVPEAPKSK
jgi:hypothetical protein